MLKDIWVVSILLTLEMLMERLSLLVTKRFRHWRQESEITLPEGDGLYLNILEEKQAREDKKRKTSK
jgi:hypothetical protein